MKTKTKTSETTQTEIPFIRNQSPRTARQRIWYANNHYGAEGVLVIDHDHDQHQYTYGYKDLKVWNPTTQQWIPLDDKFYVTTDDPELSPIEFWFRWKRYIQRRFHTDYINIKITGVERN